MLKLTSQDVEPRVRLANYIRTSHGKSSWGPRFIPDLEILLIIEGVFEFSAEQETCDVRPNEVLMIWPNERHTFAAKSPKPRGLISCIHCELAPVGRLEQGDYSPTPAPPRVTAVENSQAIHGLFKQMAKVFDGYARFREQILSSMCRAIWLTLAGQWGASAANRSPRLEQMLEYIRSRLCSSITRQDVADQFAMTPEHVNYIFRRELGLTPTQFIHRERAMRAYKMLHEDHMSIKEVSRALGFCDPFHFSRVFKRVLGFPPRQA
ncbi:MAG: AraC family transcriptional regulator [Planctomycetes bacterium]|nr:AraC family transcriptional regulator [Planctomycetota bacterium]